MKINSLAKIQTFHATSDKSAEIAKAVVSNPEYGDMWVVVVGTTPLVVSGVSVQVAALVGKGIGRSRPRGICSRDGGEVFVIKDYWNALSGGTKL